MSSGSLAALGAVSSTIYVHPAKQVSIAITGTWVGRIVLERSGDGGKSFAAVPDMRGFTRNSTSDFLDPGYIYRLRMVDFTSGSADYDITEDDRAVTVFDQEGKTLAIAGDTLLVNGEEIETGGGGGAAEVDVITVSASRDLADSDYGNILHCTTTLTLTIPATLRTKFWCIVHPSGTTSIASSGGTLLNGATTTLTRTDTAQKSFSIHPTPTANSYLIEGT